MEVGRESFVVVVVGFAGVGKSTLCGAAVEGIAGLSKLVSVTTRPPRDGEVNGVDKFFVGLSEYQRQVDAGELLVPTETYGNRYALRATDLWGGGPMITEMHYANLPVFGTHHSRFASICVLPQGTADARSKLGSRGESSLEADLRSAVVSREHEVLRALAERDSFDRTFTNAFDLESQQSFVELVAEMLDD